MDDDKAYLLFSGYYSVAAASDALSRYHIGNRIVKAPVRMKESCSFAVLIDKTDEKMARQVLDRENIKSNA